MQNVDQGLISQDSGVINIYIISAALALPEEIHESEICSGVPCFKVQIQHSEACRASAVRKRRDFEQPNWFI